jgi:acyl-CoA dehydrogenase
MDFEESDEQRLIRQSVARLCQEFPDDYWEQHDREGVFPDDFFKQMAAAGWIGVAMPERYGGAGKGIQEAAIILEEVAASGAAMNGATAIHLSIFGMHPVVKHGSEAMREKYLPAVASGKMHVAFGVTEPDAGSDTTAIETFARREGDHYLVRGRKVWTSKAMESERVLLLVRTTPRAEVKRKTDGMTLLLAELKKPEVSISPIPKLGRNAVRTCEVVYDDLEVDFADRVGAEGEGFRYLLDGLNAERILIAAESIGIGRAALRRAVRYANERVVFDRPIGKNQGIAFPLAEARIKLDAADLLTKKAAWLLDNDKPCGAEANMAKWLAAEAGFFAAERRFRPMEALAMPGNTMSNVTGVKPG